MKIRDQIHALGLRLNGPPSVEDRRAFIDKLDFNLDDEFKEFIFLSNGAAGLLADDLYLQIWSLGEMLLLNPYYEDIALCKGLFFFGSDGSNLGYAFEKSTGLLVSISFLDIGSVTPSVEGKSFMEFINRRR